MTRKHKDHQPNDQPERGRDAASEADAPNAQDAQDAQDAAAEQVEQDLNDAMRTLRDERDQLEQRLLRTAADYQNYVKRAEQNVASAREQQLIDVAKSLVTVLDTFDRALEVDPEKTTAADVLAGVSMVRQELLNALQRFGIERIDVQPGEAFDPNHHEAMMREQRDDVDTDHVTQQLQPGYALEDKVIRPAKVSVAE